MPGRGPERAGASFRAHSSKCQVQSSAFHTTCGSEGSPTVSRPPNQQVRWCHVHGLTASRDGGPGWPPKPVCAPLPSARSHGAPRLLGACTRVHTHAHTPRCRGKELPARKPSRLACADAAWRRGGACGSWGRPPKRPAPPWRAVTTGVLRPRARSQRPGLPGGEGTRPFCTTKHSPTCPASAAHPSSLERFAEHYCLQSLFQTAAVGAREAFPGWGSASLLLLSAGKEAEAPLDGGRAESWCLSFVPFPPPPSHFHRFCLKIHVPVSPGHSPGPPTALRKE